MSVFGAKAAQTAAAGAPETKEAPSGQPAQGGPNASTSTSTTSARPGGNDNQPPVIHINGTNPAYLTVGDTYADLGAVITSPASDKNLRLTVLVDNATSTDGTVQLDTTQARHAHHPLHRHRPERSDGQRLARRERHRTRE